MLLTESGHGTTALAGRPRTGRGGSCLRKSEQCLLRACADGLGRRAGGFFRVTRRSSTPWGGGYMRGSFHQTVGFGSAQVSAAMWVVGVCGSARPSQVPRGRRRPEWPPPEVLAVMFRCHHFRVIKFCGQNTESQGLGRLCARHVSAGDSWVLRPPLAGPPRREQDARSRKDKRVGTGQAPRGQPRRRVRSHGHTATLLFQKSCKSG